MLKYNLSEDRFLAIRLDISRQLGWKIQKHARENVIFRLLPIFPILMAQKCIETRWCLGHQVNQLQITWNFFSTLISWIDAVKNQFGWIWRYWGKQITLLRVFIMRFQRKGWKKIYITKCECYKKIFGLIKILFERNYRWSNILNLQNNDGPVHQNEKINRTPISHDRFLKQSFGC